MPEILKYYEKYNVFTEMQAMWNSKETTNWKYYVTHWNNSMSAENMLKTDNSKYAEKGWDRPTKIIITKQQSSDIINRSNRKMKGILQWISKTPGRLTEQSYLFKIILQQRFNPIY